MYQILKNILAGLTIEERIEMLKNVYESCGCCRFYFTE